MNNYTDLARESIEHLKENVDYRFSKKFFQDIILENYEFLKEPKGTYFEIILKELEASSLQKAFEEIFKPYLNKKRILIVGVGNIYFNADAIGPLVVSHMEPVLDHLYLLIPRVKGQSGMDSAKLVKKVKELYDIDLVIAIDALCAIETNSLFQTIQINTMGIQPGSALSSSNESITKEYLGCDVLAMGIPCVIKVGSLINEFFKDIEGFFYESLNDYSSVLKVTGKKEYQGQLSLAHKEKLLGEIGLLNNDQRLDLINDIIRPVNKDLVVSVKEADKSVKDLALIISQCLQNIFK